ncbi:MAG: hypothetical protein WC523_06310 [Patescibacteria group bacterium]|jgi:hypothetical protein
MLQHNFLTYSGKIVLQLIGEILYFPLWWYSVGFWRLLKSIGRSLQSEEEALGLFIWAKNIFVPMYGQYDWAGRIISFLVRLVQIIVRSLVLLIWSFLVLIVALLWLTLPAFLLFALFFQFIN